MLENALLVLAALYVVQILVFMLAALASRYRTLPAPPPTVDVVVAARNEELTIDRCLAALSGLTYPRDRLHVIVVNDRSTDATASIIASYHDRFPWITLINAQPGEGHMQGKVNAVSQGIDAGNGEIIMMTDADCEVQPGWVEETVRYFDRSEVGVVAGFTSLHGTSVFARMQALDWLALFSVAAAMTKLGSPVTAVGTNLCVRRTAYKNVGGYRGIPFSITEDYALFRAITHEGGFKARFPMDTRTVVRSQPCPTWHSLFRQKKRWFAGGKRMHISSIAMFFLDYLFSLLIIAALFVHPVAVLIPVAVKCAMDFLLALPAVSRFARWDALRTFPLYELYYFCYVLLFPPLVLISSDVVWKERTFS